MPPIRLKLRDLPRVPDGVGDDNPAGAQRSSAGMAVGAGIAARTTEHLSGRLGGVAGERHSFGAAGGEGLVGPDGCCAARPSEGAGSSDVILGECSAPGDYTERCDMLRSRFFVHSWWRIEVDTAVVVCSSCVTSTAIS